MQTDGLVSYKKGGERVFEIHLSPYARPRRAARASTEFTELGLDPLRAAQWIESVSDPEVRSRWAGSFYERWREKDPGTAESWLRGSAALDEQQKAKLSKQPRP